ncbi:threonine synthase-like 1 [Scleropages formosus]|uniref:Threonine synthase like 1 n=1 Tax=Scleropages formosus TaxID=113540 RepID=A0A8C9S3G8_SCLFO|nr:threonine synthase-like 1 [Scleropages formosus]XP_018596624.2 threonine synthase-like 1 [Scleropages formosus]
MFVTMASISSSCRFVSRLGVKWRFFPLPLLGWKTLATSVRLESQCSFATEKNIFLMGPPGAGKTTVGRIVAQRLGRPLIDVDDDILERQWNMPVAEKLSAVGPEHFLEEEAKALSGFSAHGCVVSLTGSNPLCSGTMQHLRRTGTVLYLDVDEEDILLRLSRMKVSRIVGQEPGVSMRDVLRYRRQFYNQCFDIRVLCASGDTEEEVAEKALLALHRHRDSESETFVSTRSDKVAQEDVARDEKHFSDVVVEGLAPDSGLYVPKEGFPKLQPGQWLRMVHMSYPQRAAIILENCIHPVDVPATELQRMVSKAYGENFACAVVAPVRHLAHNQYVQELFHGPTASFKDLALQLVPRLFAYCLPQMCNYLVLVATSGDTGSAVLDGFASLPDGDRQRIGVLVFFPENGVSEIQKLQMTSFKEGNTRTVGVTANFDFCQKAIKQMFSDPSLAGCLAVEYGTVLSTANSINWARLLPQVVYHASAYLDLVRDGVIGFGDPIDVCIPTGNFGNMMSAIYVKQMGIPIRKFICASNHNCAVADFIATGHYELQDRVLTPSISPAIDILKSSNLERFIYHASGGNGRLVKDVFSSLDARGSFVLPQDVFHKIQADVLAGWCSEEECLAAIRDVHTRTGYILDPHTAVAKVVADHLQDRTCPVVIASTAHHDKFAPAILRALQLAESPEQLLPLEQLDRLRSCGSQPVMHEALQRCLSNSKTQPHAVCQADFSLLAEQVETMAQDLFLKV